MIPICSISGFSISACEDGIDAHLLSSALLTAGETRGRDATGAAWFDGDGMVWTQKDHMRATDWVKHNEVPSDARTVICHTRAATQGSQYQNVNNHPIIVGNRTQGVVGIHNGMISNDDQLYKEMGLENSRSGEVDSEAIFAAIAYGTSTDEDGKPRLGSNLEACLSEIHGSAAVAWIEMGGDPHSLHLSRIWSSPLIYATTPRGSLIFASTKEMIERAAKAANITVEAYTTMEEGRYLHVVNGTIANRRTFTPYSDYSPNIWQGSGYSGGYGYPTRQRAALPKATEVLADYNTGELTELDGDCVRSYKYEGGAWVLKDTQPIDRPGFSKPAASTDKVEDLRAINANYEKPVITRETVYSNIAYHLFEHTTYLDGAAHTTAYNARTAAIKAWAADLVGSAQQVADALDECGAAIRQGELVITDLGNVTGLSGTIIGLPPVFPDGEYLIRVMLPNQRYHGGFEPIIVGRKLGEFVLDTGERTIDTTTGA